MKEGPAPDIVRKDRSYSFQLRCRVPSCIQSLPDRGLHVRDGLLPALLEILPQHRSHPQGFADRTPDQLQYMVPTRLGSPIPAENRDCFPPGTPAAAFALL